jgi:hypothetical protein
MKIARHLATSKAADLLRVSLPLGSKSQNPYILGVVAIERHFF